MDEKKVKSLMKNILTISDVLQESLNITLPHQSMQIADKLTKNDVFIQTVVSRGGARHFHLGGATGGPGKILGGAVDLPGTPLALTLVVSKLHEHIIADEKFKQELHDALLFEFLQINSKLEKQIKQNEEK